MAKEKLTDTQLVSAHILKLPEELRDTIEYLRQFILSVDKHIGERIKWNNPSFYYTGEMKPFDPKEYKREIIVMNLFKNRIMLVSRAVLRSTIPLDHSPVNIKMAGGLQSLKILRM